MAEQLDPGRGGRSAVRGEHARANDQAQRGNARCGSPGREESGRTLSRVGFLGSGLVAAAGALGGYAAQATAAESVQVWGLDASWSGDPGACGCAACASCLSHAANKLFANAAGADAGRAHPFCKCRVVPLVRFDEGVYNSLFTDGGGRDSVDRRYQWVQAVLTHDPPAVGSIAASAPVDTTIDAAFGRVRVRRGAAGRRVLYADIEADEVVTAAISIKRHGRTLARKVVTGVSGSRRLKLTIPADTRAGPARVRLRLTSAAGTSHLEIRGIQIPHARA